MSQKFFSSTTLFLLIFSIIFSVALGPNIVFAAESPAITTTRNSTTSLEAEAQNLIQELVQKGFTKVPENLPPKVTEVNPYQLHLEVPKNNANTFKNKPIKTVKTVNQKLKFKPYPLIGKDYDAILTEGQSLYRVAISDRVITLKEAQQIAVANNPLLEALKKKIEVAQSKLFEAKRAMYPTVQFQYEENGGILGGRFYKGRNNKVNLNQPLFYGGELMLTVRQAEQNVRTAKQEYSKGRAELIHQVRTAYHGVVKAEYNIQYQNELFNRSKTLYEKVRSQHVQKLIPEIDYLNTESQFHQVRFQAESAESDLLSARLIFQQTLNLEPDQKAAVDLKLDFVKVKADFKNMLDLALKNNPDIAIKEAAYLSAQYGVQIFSAKKLPRFDLRGSYGALGETFRDQAARDARKADIDLDPEWFWGIKGTLPIWGNSVEYDTTKRVNAPNVSTFSSSQGDSIEWRHTVKLNILDKISDITDEKSAEAAYYQAKSEYEKAIHDVTAKVREEFYNLEKSIIQIDSSISKTNYQTRQNVILEYMINLQEASPAALLEGWIEEAQDKFSFIQAVTDYKIAVSPLSQTIGDIDYFEKES